jgi:hypothetical protein
MAIANDIRRADSTFGAIVIRVAIDGEIETDIVTLLGCGLDVKISDKGKRPAFDAVKQWRSKNISDVIREGHPNVFGGTFNGFIGLVLDARRRAREAGCQKHC